MFHWKRSLSDGICCPSAERDVDFESCWWYTLPERSPMHLAQDEPNHQFQFAFILPPLVLGKPGHSTHLVHNFPNCALNDRLIPISSGWHSLVRPTGMTAMGILSALVRCLKFDDRCPLKESRINNWCGSDIWRSRRPYRKTFSNHLMHSSPVMYEFFSLKTGIPFAHVP